MKPGHWLALGSAFAGCAAALGIFLAKDPSSPDPGDSLHDSGRTVKRQNESAFQAGPGDPGTRSVAKARSSSMTHAEAFRIEGSPPAGQVSDESAWFANAERVEREATRELESLKEALQLSPYQQQQVFGVLARNSPFWMPGMSTGGSHGSSSDLDPEDSPGPTGSVSDEILPLLDEDQQQALIEEELDRRAWWEEILPQLLPPEFPDGNTAEDPALGLPAAGDTKTYEGPTELLEE